MGILSRSEASLLLSYPALLVLVLVAVIAVLWQKQGQKHDPQEPPLIYPKIPFIGHLIGLAVYRMHFWRRIHLSNPQLPIFTLPIGSKKIYVIASPQLIQAAMRKRTLSINPLTIAFADKMIGFGPSVVDLMKHAPSDGSISWMDDQHTAYELLAPGPSLSEMNTKILNSIAGIFNPIGAEFESKKFYLFLRDAFTSATTLALFGADNPLTKNPKLSQWLWDFEGGQINLLFQPFPSWTARKPYQARAKVQKVLRAYFRGGHNEDSDVSSVIKKRVAINRVWGLHVDEIADHEVGILFVSVTNAIPTLFWMIFYVFGDENLVATLQQELLAVLETRKSDDGQRECVVNVAKFRTDCPLLVSSYQEVMRLTNRQQGTRTVVEDTYLDYTPTEADPGTARTYLLKKGTTIQMPAKISNWDPTIWGPDVNDFNPKRFMTTKEQQRRQKQALNPFGGGKHLCPGRHFAFAEILGTVAILVLGFDITTPEGARVTVPEINNNLAEAVGKPLQNVQQNLSVKIRRKPQWTNVKWSFVTG